MSWKLEFHPAAFKEFFKLDLEIRRQFQKILKTRLQEPNPSGSRLFGGLKNCYKIKLKSRGYRLVYEIRIADGTLRILSVDRRDSSVYEIALGRINDS